MTANVALCIKSYRCMYGLIALADIGEQGQRALPTIDTKGHFQQFFECTTPLSKPNRQIALCSLFEFQYIIIILGYIPIYLIYTKEIIFYYLCS